MAVPIAELFVSVSADVNAAINGLNALGTKLGTTTNAFRQAAPAALAFEAAAAAIGAGLFSSIKTAADFEEQMSGVKAVMNPADIAPFGAALSDLALVLGRDTVFTSRQAASGIEELIKAGIPAADVLGGAANSALALAAATGIPVAEAANVAATAMNTFGVQAADLAHVVDVLAGTANASATDISQLQFGFQAVGPVAAQMGLSLEDTAAALGIFANNGLQSQDAGTSLKTMLLNLVPSTKKQTEAFKQLGLITDEGSNVFFNAEGHLRSLADIAEILKGSLAGLTDEQRINTLQTLFGTDAVRAAAILYKTGGDAVNTFHEAVGKVSAADAAKTRLDNLNGVLKNLGGSIERVQIQIGTLFLPALRGIAQFAKGVADALGNLSPEVQTLAVFVIGGAGALLGLVGAFILLFPVVAAMGPAFVALGAAFSFLLGPVGLIIAAIALIAGGLVFAFNNNEDFRNSVLGLWDAIQNRLWPAILTTASAIGDALGPVVSQLATAFGQFVSDVGPQVVTFFQTTLPGALAAMGAQLASLGPLFTALGGFFGSIFNVIGAIAGVGGTALQGLFENVLVPGFNALVSALGPVQPVIEAITTPLRAMADNFGLIGDRLGPVVDFFNNLTTAINAAAAAIGTFQLPDFLKPGSGVGLPGLPGPQLVPTAFTPGGGSGGGGNVIIQGNVNIGSEVDADNFLNRMAALMGASARRVNTPPDNSGNPQLVRSFA